MMAHAGATFNSLGPNPASKNPAGELKITHLYSFLEIVTHGYVFDRTLLLSVEHN